MAHIEMVWREHRGETATTWIGQAVHPNQSAVVIVAEAGAVTLLLNAHAHYSYHRHVCNADEATKAAESFYWLAEEIHAAWERAADLATIAGLAAEGLAA